MNYQPDLGHRINSSNPRCIPVILQVLTIFKIHRVATNQTGLHEISHKWDGETARGFERSPFTDPEDEDTAINHKSAKA